MLNKPKVGDVVRLNKQGLRQCFGSHIGMSHMLTLKMKITHVDDESMTDDVPTWIVKVDNPDINRFIIDNHCFSVA